MTLTFSQPVRDLSLPITDIDKDTDLWIDEIIVGPASFVATKGANVIGTGTDADPFKASVDVGPFRHQPTAIWV